MRQYNVVQSTACALLFIALVFTAACAAACSPAPVLTMGANPDYSFSDLKPGLDKSDSKSFVISNGGGQELSGTVSSDKNWLHVDTYSIKIAKAPQSIYFWVDTLGMQNASSDTGTILIDTNGGSSSIKVNISTRPEPVPVRTDTILVGKNPRYVWVNPHTNRIYVYNDNGFAYLAKLRMSSPTGDHTIRPAAPSISIIDGNKNQSLCILSGFLINFVLRGSIFDLYWLQCNDDSSNNRRIPVNTNLDRTDPSIKFELSYALYTRNTDFAWWLGTFSPADVEVIRNYQLSDPIAEKDNIATGRTYKADPGSGSVSVYEKSSNTLLTTIKVGNNPSAIAVNPANNRIYVANKNDNTVSVINGLTNTVVATVNVGREPVDIDINPDTGRIYVANWLDYTVSVLQEE